MLTHFKMQDFTIGDLGVFIGTIGGVLTSVLVIIQKSRCVKIDFCGCHCVRDINELKKEERIKKEKDNLNNTIEEQFQELEKTKQEHDELKEKHDGLQETHDELKGKHDDLQETHEDLKEKHDDLQETHEGLKEKHETITMEIKEKEALIP